MDVLGREPLAETADQAVVGDHPPAVAQIDLATRTGRRVRGAIRDRDTAAGIDRRVIRGALDGAVSRQQLMYTQEGKVVPTCARGVQGILAIAYAKNNHVERPGRNVTSAIPVR